MKQDIERLSFTELLDEFYRSHDALLNLYMFAPKGGKLFWRSIDVCHRIQTILRYDYDRAIERKRFDKLVLMKACGIMLSIWYKDKLGDWWGENEVVIGTAISDLVERYGYDEGFVYDDSPKTLVWAIKVGNELVRRIREGDPSLTAEQREQVAQSGFVEVFEEEKRACMKAMKKILSGKI